MKDPGCQESTSTAITLAPWMIKANIQNWQKTSLTPVCFIGGGMAATVAAGEVVADAIANGDERFRLFEPFGLCYAGKPLGAVIAQCAYWLFQYRDAWKSCRLNRDPRSKLERYRLQICPLLTTLTVCRNIEDGSAV